MNALLLLAALAFPQDRAAEIDFQNQLDSLRGVQLARKSTAAVRASAIAMTLTAMNDGVEVGGLVLEVVEARKLDVAALLPASAPDYPRVLGPIIARRAAELEFASMPECAEKRYMIQSWETRAWLELGGDPEGLPVLEWLIGHKDQAVAARYGLWLTKGRESALERIGQATGTKTIPELESQAKTEPELRKLDEANKRFVRFLLEENDWRRRYGR